MGVKSHDEHCSTVKLVSTESDEQTGRWRQKQRTRQALVDAARELVSAGAARPTATVTGSRSTVSAKGRRASGIVAENSSRCARSGTRLTMLRTADRKPMSNI